MTKMPLQKLGGKVGPRTNRIVTHGQRIRTKFNSENDIKIKP